MVMRKDFWFGAGVVLVCGWSEKGYSPDDCRPYCLVRSTIQTCIQTPCESPLWNFNREIERLNHIKSMLPNDKRQSSMGSSSTPNHSSDDWKCAMGLMYARVILVKFVHTSPPSGARNRIAFVCMCAVSSVITVHFNAIDPMGYE